MLTRGATRGAAPYLLVLAITAAGCSTGSVGHAIVGQTPASPNSTSSAAATLCPGGGCHSVHRADVDGDGRTDEIAIDVPSQQAPSAQEFRGRYSVVVRLATGKSLRAQVQTLGWPEWAPDHGALWQGSVHLDKGPGTQILLGNEGGANYLGYTVLTLANGALRPLPAPNQPFIRPHQAWFSKGGTSSGSLAFSCTKQGVRLTAAYALEHDGAKTITRAYRRSRSGWVLLSSRERHVPSESAAGVPTPFANCAEAR